MVKAISAFTEFCYLVRRSVISEDTLRSIDATLVSFHQHREIFCTAGVRPEGFSLPRQHSLQHYRHLIQKFGAPNGLCSSITESKHIKAVKKPWRRSSRYQALGQMLLINQHMDKLAAARVNFTARGMLLGHNLDEWVPVPPLDVILVDDRDLETDDNDAYLGEVKLAKTPGKYFFNVIITISSYNTIVHGYSRNPLQLGTQTGHLELSDLIQYFLYSQEHPNHHQDAVNLDQCPDISHCAIYLYHSAVATFYAPSDLSGRHGMHRERIHAVPSWRNGPPRNDCVFVEQDIAQDGFAGLHAARVLLFFSFTYHSIIYPCALVHWFSAVGNKPCEDTGMWMVKPDLHDNGSKFKAVVHLDCILRGAHLIGLSGKEFLPHNLSCDDALDSFLAFYVNKYIDHHANEIAF